MSKRIFSITGYIVVIVCILTSSLKAQGQSIKPKLTQESNNGSAAAPDVKAKIVYVGGDETVGYAIFKKDLTNPNVAEIRLTHISLSKTKPLSKTEDENVPIINPYSNPRWSPNGREIAFIGLGPAHLESAIKLQWEREQEWRDQKLPPIKPRWPNRTLPSSAIIYIWIMNIDGSELRPIVQLNEKRESDDINLRWSPDGKKIALINYKGYECRDIIIVDVNKGTIEELPHGGMSKDSSLSEEFCWSPDAKAIVGINRADCGALPSESGKICIIAIDGKLTDVTYDGVKLHPYWWPDGKITFCRDAYEADFWIMDSDGNNQTRIYKGRNIVEIPDQEQATYVYPFFSSVNCDTIAFQEDDGDKHVLYIKNIRESSFTEKSLEGVFFKPGEEYAYDVYLELQK